jgi:dihydrofolate reductase
MRKLIATVFNYSIDGLLADRDTEFWKFCFDLPENREPDDPAQLDFLQSAYAHIMGRTAYEGIAPAMTRSTDHPFAPILNAARKVVFSRTLKTAEWANTPPSPPVTRQKRSTSSGWAATATSWSGAASASGGRSCSST